MLVVLHGLVITIIFTSLNSQVLSAKENKDTVLQWEISAEIGKESCRKVLYIQYLLYNIRFNLILTLYDKYKKNILNGAFGKARSGKMHAIIGPSGSGITV